MTTRGPRLPRNVFYNNKIKVRKKDPSAVSPLWSTLCLFFYIYGRRWRAKETRFDLFLSSTHLEPFFNLVLWMADCVDLGRDVGGQHPILVSLSFLFKGKDTLERAKRKKAYFIKK